MVNKNITKELENNEKGHIIFNSQNPKDLKELEEILRENNELLVDFPVNEWDKFAPLLMSRRDMTQLEATRRYVAGKLLETLKEKYPKIQKYFISKDNTDYPNLAYNLTYVKDILELEIINPERVHFIMNGNKSAILCDAISILLSDDNPFDVSIYTAPNIFYTSIIPDNREKVYMWQEYNYKTYHENEDGYRNVATRPKIKVK